MGSPCCPQSTFLSYNNNVAVALSQFASAKYYEPHATCKFRFCSNTEGTFLSLRLINKGRKVIGLWNSVASESYLVLFEQGDVVLLQGDDSRCCGCCPYFVIPLNFFGQELILSPCENYCFVIGIDSHQFRVECYHAVLNAPTVSFSHRSLSGKAMVSIGAYTYVTSSIVNSTKLILFTADACTLNSQCLLVFDYQNIFEFKGSYVLENHVSGLRGVVCSACLVPNYETLILITTSAYQLLSFHANLGSFLILEDSLFLEPVYLEVSFRRLFLRAAHAGDMCHKSAFYACSEDAQLYFFRFSAAHGMTAVERSSLYSAEDDRLGYVVVDVFLHLHQDICYVLLATSAVHAFELVFGKARILLILENVNVACSLPRLIVNHCSRELLVIGKQGIAYGWYMPRMGFSLLAQARAVVRSSYTSDEINQMGLSNALRRCLLDR